MEIERQKQIVDRAHLAAALSIAENTVLARVREGMPVLQRGRRGKPWQFDLAECVVWDRDRAIRKATGVVKGDETEAQLKRRLLEARVKGEEIEAARKASEIVPVDEVESAVIAAFTEVRQAMLSIPDRAALRLMAAEDETAIKEVLREEIDLALHALADSDLLEGWEDEPCE
ncbi:terminase small subunit [Pseudodesulfovibrio sp. zrk46]|uniref:terminase small subunit n=1 Tax=Pseudodesulfovibrio sp. zrk46 TaxID=2725288 RepID=UPI0014498809|nr:terminase small subunit [Pseudodesulfovibrio sp. zrk46]QJB57466.1 terminase small subunit [Pseudodesulfovibrio sp. zrk46]